MSAADVTSQAPGFLRFRFVLVKADRELLKRGRSNTQIRLHLQ